MKLRAKTTITILIPVLIALFIVIGFSTYTFYVEEKQSAQLIAEAIAEKYSNEIEAEMEIALDAARTISDMASGFVENGHSRQALDDSLKKVLENNEKFYGVWIGFESNAFDGKDLDYIDTIGHDKTGRFIPYWDRFNGSVNRHLLENYDNQEEGGYYISSFESGKEVVLNPFEYEIDGQSMLMTSLTIPIKVGGKVIGVAGVDISLDTLQEISNGLEIYKTGFGRLIASNGMIVAHPKEERRGQIAGEFEGEVAEGNFEKIKSGKVYSEVAYSVSENTDMFKTFSPFNVGASEEMWSFGVVVPEKEIYENLNKAIVGVLALGLVSMIFIGFIIFFIASNITKPIVFVTRRIRQLSELDFTLEDSTNGKKLLARKDEIGDISKSLRTMRNNVAEFILKTSQSAEHVAASSEELTATAEQTAIASEEVAKTIEEIARGATDQARDTENTANNIEELGTLLDGDALLIKELSLATDNIDNEKEEGFIILKNLVENTDANNKVAGDIYEIIMTNNESAEKIENASGMIQSIADQTNLLALNAAIEAARAGDAGKGFAVVAEEIRKLAEESNKFTEDIKKVIDELKSKSQIAVESMDSVKAIVGEQSQSVNQTENKFEAISEDIALIKDITDKLNNSFKTMINNKNNVVGLVENLSAISEENAAGTQEAAASMEEQAATVQEISNSGESLALTAEELRALIERFKI